MGWFRNQTRVHVNPLLGHDKLLLAFVFGPMGGSSTVKWIYYWESVKVGLLKQFNRKRVVGPT